MENIYAYGKISSAHVLLITKNSSCKDEFGKLYEHKKKSTFIDILFSMNTIKPRSIRFVYRVRVVMFSSTSNNILVISWQFILMMEETGVRTRRNH
jgi:hypothetical protein